MTAVTYARRSSPKLNQHSKSSYLQLLMLLIRLRLEQLPQLKLRPRPLLREPQLPRSQLLLLLRARLMPTKIRKKMLSLTSVLHSQEELL